MNDWMLEMRMREYDRPPAVDLPSCRGYHDEVEQVCRCASPWETSNYTPPTQPSWFDRFVDSFWNSLKDTGQHPVHPLFPKPMP